MNGSPSGSLMSRPRTVAESTKGFSFTCRMETWRLSCRESWVTATLRTIGGKMRKPTTV